MTEMPTANGDLTFSPTEDPLTQARNNLRYWMDRHPGGSPEVLAAARFLIETIDNEGRQ